jgi:Flp pilus assembly pilin Flp
MFKLGLTRRNPMHPHRNVPKRDRKERGAGLVEYALLLALIAVVCFGAVSFFGSQSAGGFGKSKDCIAAAYDGSPIPGNCR